MLFRRNVSHLNNNTAISAEPWLHHDPTEPTNEDGIISVIHLGTIGGSPRQCLNLFSGPCHPIRDPGWFCFRSDSIFNCIVFLLNRIIFKLKRIFLFKIRLLDTYFYGPQPFELVLSVHPRTRTPYSGKRRHAELKILLGYRF